MVPLCVFQKVWKILLLLSPQEAPRKPPGDPQEAPRKPSRKPPRKHEKITYLKKFGFKKLCEKEII